ncbi:hypothetical protein V5799_022841, partial [Amblyomma americanum]
YGVEHGYLVLEDLKTRDLPRPPPAGWDSAKRLGLVAAAALCIFAAVVALGILSRVTRSDDGRRPADPVHDRNGTNETAAAPKFYVVTEIEDDIEKDLDVESAAESSQLYGVHEAASKRRKPSAVETAPGRIGNSPSRWGHLMTTPGMFDGEDDTVTFGDGVSSDIATDSVAADTTLKPLHWLGRTKSAINGTHSPAKDTKRNRVF